MAEEKPKDEYSLIPVVDKEGNDIDQPKIPPTTTLPLDRLNKYINEQDNLLGLYTAKVQEMVGCDRLMVVMATAGALVLHMLNCSPQHASYWYLLISCMYPIYASFSAMESDKPVDASVWLLYWVIWGTVMLSGYHRADSNMFIVLLTAASVWLWFPVTQGVHFLYFGFVRALALIQHGRFDKDAWEQMHPAVHRAVHQISEDAKKKIGKYVDPGMLDALNEAQVIQLLESASTKKETASETPSEINDEEKVIRQLKKEQKNKAEMALMTSVFKQMTPEQLQSIVDIAKSSQNQQQNAAEP